MAQAWAEIGLGLKLWLVGDKAVELCGVGNDCFKMRG